MAAPGEEFEHLFRVHYGPLVRALTFAAGASEDAADAVQDAFVQLHRHWSKVGRYDDQVRWLRRVAVNRIANQQRGRRRRELAVAQLRPVTHVDPDPSMLDLRDAVALLA